MEKETVYGHCRHGENMATCWKCKNKNSTKIQFLKNDISYCYFIEDKKTNEWLMENPNDKRTYLLTKDPLKALKFDGDEGKAKAKVYLALEQSAGNMKGFIVTEHEFV